MKMEVIQKIKAFLNRPSRKVLEEKNSELEEKNSELERELNFYRNKPIPVIRETVNFKTICCQKTIPIDEAKPYIVEFVMKEMSKELWEEVKYYAQMDSYIDDELRCHILRLKLRVGVEGNEINSW